MLLLSGHKGKRKAYKYARILLHEVATDSGYGQRTLLKDTVERIDHLNRVLRGLLTERSKMTDKQIDKYMAEGRDRFIDAQQALKYGIIDEII